MCTQLNLRHFSLICRREKEKHYTINILQEAEAGYQKVQNNIIHLKKKPWTRSEPGHLTCIYFKICEKQKIY